MATTRPKQREEFNRARELIAAKRITISGKVFDPGEPLDKTLATTRTLRQLYDQRKIEMLPPVPGSVNEENSKPTMPDFDDWSVELLTDWLEAHDKIPRFGSTHEQLVFKAIEVWEGKYGEKVLN